MLKFYLKKECLNFTQNWLTPEKHMMHDEPDKEDLLRRLLQDNFQDGLDRVIRSINTHED